MDWSSLILIGIFFGLPLLQRILEQARRSGEPLPAPEELPHADAVEEERSVAVASERARQQQFADERSGWSEGWTPWPSSTPEERPLPDPSGRSEYHSAPAAMLDEESAPLIVAPPPPLPEFIPIRAAERRTRSPRALEFTLDSGSIRSSRTDRAPLNNTPRPALLLGNATDLRRAIILKEVLGPPLALREPGQSP